LTEALKRCVNLTRTGLRLGNSPESARGAERTTVQHNRFVWTISAIRRARSDDHLSPQRGHDVDRLASTRCRIRQQG
jgi:hypothetical protein